jgi:hypothetical protein
MATTMLNFPIAVAVDAFLSFIQHRFTKPEITPSAYRWNSDNRQSRIRISGSYVIDDEKPGSRPSITVERGTFTFAHRAIDNLQSAEPNTFLNPKYKDWMDGIINITCESRVASEASSLAQFLAMELQANRHSIAKITQCIKDFTYHDIGPEEPRRGDVETRTWRVVLRLRCSIYIGWVRNYAGSTVPFNKAELIAISPEDPYSSETGSTTQGSDLLVDTGADFGLLTTNDPQLLASELNKEWYYIVFEADTNATKLVVTEIIDNNTLRLKYRQADGTLIPYDAAETETGLQYRLEWNAAHMRIVLPTNT